MSIAPDSRVILQRLVSVTSDILINTFTYCHTTIILISIFLAILDSDLHSCYLPITLTSDTHNHEKYILYFMIVILKDIMSQMNKKHQNKKKSI